MTVERMEELLSRFPHVSLAVVGDFFLDKYLIVEQALTEVSLETRLDAYQVVGRRCSPGAAGTVTNNLSALEVGRIRAVGCIGEDGEGFELRRGLEQRRVDMTHLFCHPDWFTPTYTKPMLRDENGRESELNRLDIKNRAATPREIEDGVLGELQRVVPQVQAVVVLDQIAGRDLGVITDRVREGIQNLAKAHPDVVFFADSRENIGLFRDVTIKPNKLEAARACGYEGTEEALSAEDAQRFGAQLVARNGRPAFVTAGVEGIVVFDGAAARRVPAVPVPPPVDIVGAGDSTTAGIVAALCAGATLHEAAVMGNCVASITVQPLGTTGTATREQVSRRFREHVGQFEGV